jgi:hypothetical protein
VAHGSKLTGGFALTRTGQRRWILVKVRDEHAREGSDITAERPASVRSGRTWQDLARLARRVGAGHRRAQPAHAGTHSDPVTASAPRAAAIDSGTAMPPRRAAVATDGHAPAARAARSQRIQASEPVPNRFGPRLSPTRSANGRAVSAPPAGKRRAGC